MANTEMLVIKRGYDFSKWLLQHTGKFPRSYRFSVAAKLENGVSKSVGANGHSPLQHLFIQPLPLNASAF